MQKSILLFCLLLTGAVSSQAQELPPCSQRPTILSLPIVRSGVGCLEEVIHDQSGGELGFTALATGPDGTLYATRPRAGQVLALRDQDGDGLPETPRVLAEGMTLPNGIAYHADALYISGGSHIYRLMLDGERALEVLIDDLPAGYTGFWTGDLTVGPDERLYVATGAPCDFCEPEEAGRGAILSFALDGSDRQVVATGLRQPADLAFREGVLWTVDTARDALEEADLDELNRVEAGAHFGWPYCVGLDNRPDWRDAEFNCEEAVAPALTFPTHSTPLGLAAYSAGTLPAFEGTLLVVLGGTDNELAVEGYSLVMVPFDEAGDPVEMVEIVPGAGGLGRDLERSERHYRQLSFFPHRPLDVAVSPEGWIYVSVGDGQIVALRP